MNCRTARGFDMPGLPAGTLLALLSCLAPFAAPGCSRQPPASAAQPPGQGGADGHIAERADAADQWQDGQPIDATPRGAGGGSGDATTDSTDPAGADGSPADLPLAATPGDSPYYAAVCLADELPEPGDPCAELGAQRCTNAGAVALSYRCLRKNRVTCAKDPTDGKLRWQLLACPTVSGTCATAVTAQQMFCEENSRGTKCCPSNCFAEKYSIAQKIAWYPLDAMWCKPSEYNKKSCPGHGINSKPNTGASHYISACGFRDEFPQAEPYFAQIFKSCGEFCKDCLYKYAIERCPDFTGKCTPPNWPDENCEWEKNFHCFDWPKVNGKCVLDADTNKLRCAEDCKEACGPDCKTVPVQ